jgi:hypothetical protein
MSEEALAQHGATQSLCLQVANSLNTAHRYCDPDNAQRAASYVRQDHDIRAYGFLNGWTPE